MNISKIINLCIISTLAVILLSCSRDALTSDTHTANHTIIADHTVVGKYSTIPDKYLDTVKAWLVDAAGESHSAAYRDGMNSVETSDPEFQVQTFDGTIPAVTTTALRLGRHASVGEGAFWTNTAAIKNIKSLIETQHNAGNPIHAILQAWCWDFTRTTGAADGWSDEVDPVYGCHWYGSSVGGPDGDHIWGLDESDYAITGNSVSLQTYLDVIDEYNEFCAVNGYACRAVFSTGPVDGQSYDGERGYQRYVKHQAIREYVQDRADRILFDYADILCYNDSNERHELTWTDYNNVTHTFQGIHPDNLNGGTTGHIGYNGARRIARAIWWMLARIAGWDGN